MSSSDNFTVYKTLPYNVYARATGKWDYLQSNQTFNSSQTVNINMTNYDGLSMDYQPQHLSAMPLDFSATVLPWKWDYYNYLETSKYCFMPLGQYYHDVQIKVPNYDTLKSIGDSLVINGTVVSGFTNINFLQLKDAYNFTSNFTTYEVCVKVNFTQVGSYQTIFAITNGKVTLGTYSNKIKLWTDHQGGGNEEQGGTTTLSANTDYWVKVVYDGSIYTVYLSTTGAFSGEETTELTVTPDGVMQNPVNILFGSSYNNWYLSKGSIDLDGTYIKVNGSDWWSGTTYVLDSLQGCTYNYTDDGSATTLNAFVVNNDKTVVLTPDNSYTNGYYLGTVNIPAHTVYTYSETTNTWSQPVLSANGTIGGNSFAVAMSSTNMNYYAWKAFNGDTVYSSSNVAHTNNSMPAWFEFYNPDPLVVTKMTIYNGNIAPIDWQFQCSDDNTTWTTLTSGTNTELSEGGEWDFNVSNSGAHKYYRFYVTSGNYQNYVSITEFVITAHTVTGVWS